MIMDDCKNNASSVSEKGAKAAAHGGAEEESKEEKLMDSFQRNVNSEHNSSHDAVLQNSLIESKD